MKPIKVISSRLMNELKSSLFVEYNKERIGIHVSDLIYCSRESVFRKLNPQTVTDKELNFFTSGQAIHTAIQTLAKYHKKYEIEKEIEFIPSENEYTKDIDGIKDLKISAHIDLFDTVNNIPIEAKTARKARLGIYNKNTRTWSEETPKSFNVTQLKIYMALTDSDKGFLIYQLLMNFEDNPFTMFEITMTKEERIELLKWLTIEAVNYVKALKERNPALARHVAGDNELNWKCTSCRFNQQCTDMRNIEYARNRK